MAIDFRFGIDWNDNNYINWNSQEGDPLNLLTTAKIETYSVAGGTIGFNTFSDPYGLDYVTATSNTIIIARDGATNIGEIIVSPNTQYTAAIWQFKNSSSEDATVANIFIQEQNSSSSTVLATRSSSAVAYAGFVYGIHYVTFTTTATTNRLDFNVFYAGTPGIFSVLGMMLVSGAEVPTRFNDGEIKVVTDRVVEARWNVGYKTSIVNGAVANENRLECALYNLDDYITQSKYEDVHRIYIEGSDDGGTTWTRLYTGWTHKWMPIFDTVNPDQHLRFTGVSSRFYLAGINSRVDMQESKTIKQIVQAILDEVQLPDGSTLTLDILFSGSTISYAGQNWDEEVDLLRALADTVGGEGWIFWFDRNDEPQVLAISNLNDVTFPPLADLLISDYARGSADFRYADPWFNKVSMKVSPRKLSTTSDKRLWRLPENLSIDADEVKTVLARFNDEDKPYQIGARNVSYDNYTTSGATPTVTLTSKSTSVYIEFDNTGNAATTVTDIQIIGQKVKTWDAYFEELYLDNAITTNGNNTLTLNYDITDDRDKAESVISNWLDIFGEKQARLWSIVVLAGQSDSDLIDYTIAHEAAVTYPDSTQYKHTVIGEAWAWRKNGQYEKKWYLEKHGQAIEPPTRV